MNSEENMLKYLFPSLEIQSRCKNLNKLDSLYMPLSQGGD